VYPPNLLDAFFETIFQTSSSFWTQIEPVPRFQQNKKITLILYNGADKSLARPGRKQAAATEDFEFHIPCL
jgi:hypothetical protein